MRARNRAGIGLSYRTARLQKTFKNTASVASQLGGIGSLGSILGLLKSLKIRAQNRLSKTWGVSRKGDFSAVNSAFQGQKGGY